MSSSTSLATKLITLLVGSLTNRVATPAKATAPATKADYPMKTCLVSGAKLGGMGKPVSYLYKQVGQPDRTVIFCCKSCIKKFEKEPAKFLAKLDAAETPAKVTTNK